ncbi:MAG: hypothetical protein CFE24_03845 [Flavobacterium sp. BFFFF2]|nr:MAG: hypothetical protein CFE24_03845 [Flavobacterium sp. BFFFF2]
MCFFGFLFRFFEFMSTYRSLFGIAFVVALVLIIGYINKKNRVVCNFKETYYVIDYFTISKFISLLLVFIGLLYFWLKKLNG